VPPVSSEPYQATRREREEGDDDSPSNLHLSQIRGKVSESGVKKVYKTNKIPRRPFPTLRKTGRLKKTASNSFNELTNCKVLDDGYQELLSKILDLGVDGGKRLSLVGNILYTYIIPI
jgi:hypothetical protein